MARFIGGVQGSRNEVTRLGHASTGMMAYVNGWNCGVDISAVTDPEDRDTFIIKMNGGSNGSRNGQVLGIVKDGVFTPEKEYVKPAI